MIWNKTTVWVAAIVLGAVTFLVFSPMLRQEFVNFDDPGYVLENPQVKSGLNPHSIAWAFRSGEQGNWHPLTWISLMADYQIGRGKPWLFKLTNLLLHVANTVLLFLLFRRMTGLEGPSWFIAALFALHPLHVESVAWVAERKDVLSVLFGVISVHFYVKQVQNGSFWNTFFSLFFFALSLLAKPMLVTLPFLLLLLDYWPLGVFSGKAPPKSNPNSLHNNIIQFSFLRRLWQKAPFFLLSGLSCWITYTVQQRWGAVKTMESYPLDTRLANAVVGYVSYIGKMLWPMNLSVFYPHPGDTLSAASITCALIVLILITIFFLWTYKRFPWLFTGWFWYLGTLVPVIGLVQVGRQAIADRYTYIPLIGLFIMIVWSAAAIRRKYPKARNPIVLAGFLWLLFCTIFTFRQVRIWQDSVTLNTNAIEVNADNYVAHNNLGSIYAQRKQFAKAQEHFQEALRIQPHRPDIRCNLANLLLEQGFVDQALSGYNAILEDVPRHAPALYYRAQIHVLQGDIESALLDVRRLAEAGRADQAADVLHAILAKEPQNAKAKQIISEIMTIRDKNSKTLQNK